jgi:hypothetical protein
MEEEFKKLEEVDGYEISNMGYIRKIKTGHIFKGYIKIRKDHVIRIKIQGNLFNLTKLVIKYFIDKNEIKNYIGFKNDNPNDIRAENIRFQDTPYYRPLARENKKLLWRIGKNHHTSKPFKVDNKKYYTLKEASIKLNIPMDVIRKRLINKNIVSYQYID